MRWLLAASLLLAAACGNSEQDLHVSGVEADSIRLRAIAGTVTIATGLAGEVRVTAESPDEGKLRAFVECRVENRVLTIQPAPDAAEWTIDMTITVPPGLPLNAVCRAADVSVRGSWGRLDVRTVGGNIDVDVDRATAGTLRSDGGAVEVTVRRDAPTRDLSCESVTGDVSVALPANYRGRIYLTTRRGRLDVAEQKNLRTTVGPDEKTVLAFAGAALTDVEREDELAKFKSPQAVRATSGSGTVTFRLLEDR